MPARGAAGRQSAGVGPVCWASVVRGSAAGLGAAAGAATIGTGGLNAFAATPTQDALVIDAMGEVREVYTDELCREMIDSGLNSITVTLCDPKSYEAQAYDFATHIARNAAPLQKINAQLFGPAAAPIAKIRGRHRVRLLIKAEKSAPIQNAIRAWISQFKPSTNLRLQIDIDPQSFY